MASWSAQRYLQPEPETRSIRQDGPRAPRQTRMAGAHAICDYRVIRDGAALLVSRSCCGDRVQVARGIAVMLPLLLQDGPKA